MPSQKYLARIHIMKKEKAVPEDDYRDILYRKFRVATSSALSDSQALVFIRTPARLSIRILTHHQTRSSMKLKPDVARVIMIIVIAVTKWAI